MINFILSPSLEECSVHRTKKDAEFFSHDEGCMIGALSCLYLGDRYGRRKVIFYGAIIMICGATLQATAFHLVHFIIGRIVTGYGNGLITATVPTWQACVFPVSLIKEGDDFNLFFLKKIVNVLKRTREEN
jgi:fucose permease